MANLVTSIMQLLTPDMIGRIATLLGLDSDKVQRGVGAAVPAILAGLGAAAMQPGGAQKVADAAQQNTGTLGNLANLLTGSTSMAESGSGLLSSLVGTSGGSALANAIGKFTGLDQGAGSSLLGVLTPIVLGGLAQQSSGDMSAKGISGLLSSQKDNIAAAMPSGFRELLSGSGLLDSLGGTAQATTAGAGQAARSATGAATATASAASDASRRATAAAATAPASRGNSWLYWLIAALIILGGLYYLYARPTARVTTPQTTTTTPSTTTPPASTTTPPATREPTTTPPSTTTETTPSTGTAPTTTTDATGTEVTKEITDSLNSLQSTMSGITDAASAQAALPRLQAAQSQIDRIGSTLSQMSPDQRKTLSALVAPVLPKVNEMFDKVLAIPGVSDILKPTIDALRARLSSFAS